MNWFYNIKIWLILAQYPLLQINVIQCFPKPYARPGLFGGMVGGALGSIIGNSLSNHHHNPHYNEYHSTTIDRLETFANGCYRQVIKEPDSSNNNDFIETQQIICPPNVEPPPVSGLIITIPPIQGVDSQQIFVLSKRTGTYGNSGNSLTCSSLLSLLLITLLLRIMY
ncbi:uncharacterized protein LOC142229200 [Haematobia irritans]|uniref:uncharacterized protein LOC142229200 n=1 Tax=Haematobia irritans TaxID=7368 RepID=UPI003F4F9301